MPILNVAIRKSPDTTSAITLTHWLVLGCFVLLFACSTEKGSLEEQIQQFLDQAVSAAEARDHSALGELIHNEFSSEKLINKHQLIATARAYFFRHKNIHLFSKLHSVESLDEDKAFVVVYIAMAGQTISDMSELANLRARVYRFELELEDQGEWRVKRARWQTSSLNEML